MKHSKLCPFMPVNVVFAVAACLASSVCAADKVPGQKVTSRTPVQTVNSGVYRQQIRTNFTVENGLPESPIHNIAYDKKVYASTDKGIASFDNGRWQLVYSSASPVTFLTAIGGKVCFITDSGVFELRESGQANQLAASVAEVKPTSLLTMKGSLLVGTATGLYRVDAGTMMPVAAVNQLLADQAEIRQMAAHDSEVVVAASGGLISYNISTKQAKALIPRNQQAGWALQDVRGVGFDSKGNLWFAALQGIGQRTEAGWDLYTGYEGLPYNDFTCLATGPDSDVWFGTRMGAIHFTGSQWEYRQGKRWLVDDDVTSIAITPSGDAWFATPAGVTCIEQRSMTLREKSAYFNSEIDQYHRRTPFGYVDAAYLSKPGDKSKWTQHDSDNDGLWTSMYGAGECFEFAVTRTAKSKKRANDAFRAVAFLSEAPQGGEQSPPVGFPARTILPIDGRNPNDHDNAANDLKNQQRDPLWKVITPRWPVSADKKWYWKTDTSSDELDGHYFFYALYNDLVAETDEEKRYVKDVVNRVTTHLIDHDFALIDHDGKPTRWGQFAPSVLNTDVLTDCRGLNSLSILSYLLVAEHVTGDAKYRQKYEELLNQFNYFTNVLNAKNQNGPGSGNQSDDEMAFMCYYTLLSYETNPKYRRQYMRSFARYFAQEEPEACPLFSLIFAAFYEPVRYYGRGIDVNVVKDSVETLQRFPLDRIHWAFKNSHRLDIVPLGRHILESTTKGHLRNGKVIPIDERFVNHWNLDPWRLDSKSAGTELADGASFLLPYWLGVYHGLIKDTSVSGATPALPSN